MNEHHPLELLTVASYITRLNRVLATQQGRIKGEVTSVKRYPTAVYFTVKDKEGQALLDCMMWSNTYNTNGVEIKVGDEIIVTGAPDIYAPYGKFSFKTTTIEYAGEGALKLAYDKLKATLTNEGLLAPERKRPMSTLPTKIGVITSLSGVVIQDFTANLSRHGFIVKTVDSRVEGKGAIHDLLAAIRTMARRDIEALVIMRGGGSWESLQAFNTESVVRAIAGFKVPVVTGIGHDVDVTLSEMVADIACSTPTAVAEALNEQWDGLIASVDTLHSKTLGRFQRILSDESTKIIEGSNTIFRTYERRLMTTHINVSNAVTVISSVFSQLARRMRDTNNALRRATGIMKVNLHTKQHYLAHLSGRLRHYSRLSIGAAEQSMANSFKRVARSQASAIKNTMQLLPGIERVVAINDPRRNMRLGYSLSYVNGRLIRSTSDISLGDTLITHLGDGTFTSEVKKVE